MRLKILVCVLWLVCGGCTTVVISPTSDEQQLAISSVRDLPITYPKGTTFRVTQRFVSSKTLTDEELTSAYQQYQQQIENALLAWGYHLASDDEQAEYHVRFAIALSSDVNDQLISQHFGITPGLYQKDKLEKASLFLAIFDSASQQRVWRATVQGFIQQNNSNAERTERAQKAVRGALRQFFVTG